MIHLKLMKPQPATTSVVVQYNYCTLLLYLSRSFSYLYLPQSIYFSDVFLLLLPALKNIQWIKKNPSHPPPQFLGMNKKI